MASRGVNKVILVGNLGADPESRYMPNGNAVTNIRVATSEAWKDRNTGEQQERTEWHRVTFYRRLAEVAAEYLRKGSKIYIEGRLQTRSWEQDGIKRYATEIIADQMQMLDSREGGQHGAPAATGQARAPAAPAQGPSDAGAQPAPAEVDNFDDDIPF